MPWDGQRQKGQPRSDVERVMRHYGVDEETACYYLTIHPVEELLPERGYGLTTMVGYTIDDMATCLDVVENSLGMGQKAKLEIYNERLPMGPDLDTFYWNLAQAGFHTSYPIAAIVKDVPTTSIILEKGSPQWAALIPLIPTALIVGLIAFGITKIGDISKALLPLLLTGVGGLIILAAVLTRKPVIEAAGRYLERR